MASSTHEDEGLNRRRESLRTPERRHGNRLPEELQAVIEDSVVASVLFDELPDEQKRREAEFVSAGPDRAGRASRAVEVVRHVLRRRRAEK